MANANDEARKLADKLGVNISTTVQTILNQSGGVTRNAIPKSVWGNTLLELVSLAISGDQDAQTAKKILSQQDRLKGKNHPG